MNPSDHDMELGAKTTAALCHPIETWNENAMPTGQHKISACIHRSNLSQNIPKHLTDLIQRSLTHLTEDQIKITSQLLVEYQDIFPKIPVTLGE